MINITPCLILIEILMIYWDNDTFTVIYCQTIYQKKIFKVQETKQELNSHPCQALACWVPAVALFMLLALKLPALELEIKKQNWDLCPSDVFVSKYHKIIVIGQCV